MAQVTPSMPGGLQANPRMPMGIIWEISRLVPQRQQVAMVGDMGKLYH
jgi:hypothetical protein